MKKKLFTLSLFIICLAILTGGTLAYFTSVDIARNEITTGAVQVAVMEQQSVGGQLQPYPQQPIAVMPGTSVSKIISAKNLESPAWIRMRYEILVLDAEGKAMQVTADELSRIIHLDTATENWIAKDGWWYYETGLKTGETTKPLFTTVTFAGAEMGNAYQLCTVKVQVTAQAVQKTNNGTTVLEAAGWPEE